MTITTQAGDLVVVFVCLSANDGATATMTDDQGGTYFLVNNALWSSSANSLLCFVRDDLVVSGTSTTITCASGSNDAGALVAIACTGGTRAGYKAIRSAGWQENQASGGTPTPVLDRAALDTNLTIVAVGSGDTTTTEPTNWTERQDTSQATPTTALAVATRDSGFSGTSIAFGATAGAVFASFAIEVDGSPDASTELGIGIAASRQKIYHDPNETNTIGGTLTTHGTDLTVTSVANATDTITVPSNDMITTEGPLYLSGSNLPGGTDDTTPYYWIRSTATTGKLATSRQDAVAGTAVNLTSDGSGTITIVRTVNSQSDGRSAFITAAALGTWANSPEKPTDSLGNDYTAYAGSPISYVSFTASEAGVWAILRGLGGAAHTFSKTWAQEVPGSSTGSDEPTIVGMEVTGVGAIKAATQSEPSDAATITSNAITVGCHAILVCVIFGHGPIGQDHSYTWKNGFQEWFQASNDADTHGFGYIQVAVGWRRVATGGSYTAKASGTSNEGGQMYLLGLEDIAFHEIAPAAATATATGVEPSLTSGSVMLAPSPATATATGVDPVVSTPSQDITADPATATATGVTPALTSNATVTADSATSTAVGVDPSLTAGAVTFTASPAAGTGTGVTPTLTAGAVTTTADPAAATATGVTPTVAPGSVTAAPAPAAATATGADPTLAPGAVSLAPAPASATAVGVDPTLATSSTDVTPDPATASAVGVTPTLAAGGVTTTPDPAAATAAGVASTLAPGAVTITAAPAASAAVGVAPTLAPGAVTTTSSPAGATGAAVDPSLAAGGVTVTASPAAATAVGADPTLVPGAVTITAAPAAATSAGFTPTVTSSVEPRVFVLPTGFTVAQDHNRLVAALVDNRLAPTLVTASRPVATIVSQRLSVTLDDAAVLVAEVEDNRLSCSLEVP